jgi:hypothetical protein
MVLFLVLVGQARADLTALGVSPSEPIYVQEFWSSGKPYYRILNFAEKEVAIGLTAPDGTRTGPWKIPAHDHRAIPAPIAKPGVTGYVLLQRDETRVGALPPPVDRNVPEEKGELTCMGYNGNGGQYPNVWMLQKQSTFQAGDVIEMTFLLKATDGGLRLTRTDDDRLPHGQFFLEPIDVASETLTVKKEDKQFAIDCSAPRKNADWHRVTVRFQAPRVRAMKAGVVMGHYYSASGSGGALARSVVLLHRADGKPAPKKDAAAWAEANKLQGTWDHYDPKTTRGNLLLIHGNRIFTMPYEDDERVETLHLSVAGRQGGDSFTLETKDGKWFIVLKTGGRLEYTLEKRILRIVRPAERKDVWGFGAIRGEYRSAVR